MVTERAVEQRDESTWERDTAADTGGVRAFNYDRRRAFTRHLRGDGVEIGALHNPLDLSAANVDRVRYLDRYDVDGLRAHYPELRAFDLVPVHIVDDGQTLATLPDASLDFIVANNMIEHCDDPLGTLAHWLAKLREGGTIYLTAPDKRVGWDERRPLTTWEHLVGDYRAGREEMAARNAPHFAEFITLLTLQDDAEQAAYDAQSSLEERIAHAIATDYSIHFHVFTFESFRGMLARAREELGLPLVVADAAPPIPESWEFIYVLRKATGGGAAVGAVPEAVAAMGVTGDAETLMIALAKASIKIGSLETKRWEAEAARTQADTALATANGRIWELETAVWRAETRAWEAETKLWHLSQQQAGRSDGA